MRHNAGTGSKFIRQLDKTKVLRSKHASVKSNLEIVAATLAKAVATTRSIFPSICIDYVVIHRVKSEQISSHLSFERERRTISGCRTSGLRLVIFR